MKLQPSTVLQQAQLTEDMLKKLSLTLQNFWKYVVIVYLAVYKTVKDLIVAFIRIVLLLIIFIVNAIMAHVVDVVHWAGWQLLQVEKVLAEEERVRHLHLSMRSETRTLIDQVTVIVLFWSSSEALQIFLAVKSRNMSHDKQKCSLQHANDRRKSEYDIDRKIEREKYFRSQLFRYYAKVLSGKLVS